MNARTARQLLRLYRPGGEDDGDREFRAAFKTAGKSAEVEAAFQRQIAFDCVAADRLESVIPEVGAEQLEGCREKFAVRRRRARFSIHDPAMLAVGFSTLVLVGLLVWVLLTRIGGFAGMDEAATLARTGDAAGAEEYDPLTAKAGTLDDWFLLQGFEGFKVPPGFEDFDVVGVRLFHHEAEPIAAVAVPIADLPDGRAFFYMFDSRPLGIMPEPEETWRMIDYGSPGAERVLAVRAKGGMTFMIASKGTRGDMERFLSAVEARPESN